MSNARNLANLLNSSGVLTADAGVKADNITIDGTEIDLSSGDLTLDSGGDIILDADGANIIFKDGGTSFGEVKTNSTPDHFIFTSLIQDKDYFFQGNDGGSVITALQLDMSDKGAAIFNGSITVGSGEGIYVGGTSSANNLNDYEEGTHQTAITMASSGTVTLNTSYDRFSYTKIGRLVTITGNPRIASVSSPVGSMSMTLPFTSASGQTDENRSGGFVRYYDNSAGSGSYVKLMGWSVSEGTSTLLISNTHTHNHNVTPAADDEFYFSFSYITA